MRGFQTPAKLLGRVQLTGRTHRRVQLAHAEAGARQAGVSHGIGDDKGPLFSRTLLRDDGVRRGVPRSGGRLIARHRAAGSAATLAAGPAARRGRAEPTPGAGRRRAGGGDWRYGVMFIVVSPGRSGTARHWYWSGAPAAARRRGERDLPLFSNLSGLANRLEALGHRQP